MAFDGVVLKSIIKELNDELAGGKIDKIYQPEKDEIILNVRTEKGAKKLFISADPNYPRINLTGESFENPEVPPLFCMILRKHIGGGKILSVTQDGSDRILYIKISSYNDFGDITEKTLAVEIMSRHSNIVIFEETGKVIDSIKRVDFTLSSKRQLLPGLIYERPPGQDKLDFNGFDEKHLLNYIKERDEVSADKLLMSVYDGISPLVSREAAFFVFKENGVQIRRDEAEKINQFISGVSLFMKKIINNEFTPVILYEKRLPKYFSAIDLEQYGDLYSKEYISSPGEMIDLFYSRLHFERKMSIKTQDLTKTVTNLIDKLLKKKQIHEDTILNAPSLEELRLCGELLTANIHLLKDKAEEVTLLNYYDGTEKSIKLNPMLSPSGNIQKYYKEYRRGKTAVSEAEKQLETTISELEFLKSELVFIKNASDKKDIDAITEELREEGYLKTNKNQKNKKKQPPKGFLKTVSTEGFEIVSGRNNYENDELTLKIAGPNDLWFHIKDYPGTHTILFLNGKEPTDKAIYEAAKISAGLSKDKSGKIEIDYTKVRYVKKPRGSKPGMVIYTDYKTIIIDTDKED